MGIRLFSEYDAYGQIQDPLMSGGETDHSEGTPIWLNMIPRPANTAIVRIR